MPGEDELAAPVCSSTFPLMLAPAEGDAAGPPEAVGLGPRAPCTTFSSTLRVML